MDRLKNYLRVLLREYWGEVTGGVTRDQGTKEAQRTGPAQPDTPDDPMGEDEDDPFMLDKKGKYVPDDAKRKIKKYFKDMKMEPTDKPGKTYK